MKYECDRCGACCQGHLIVQAELLDALREPRLLDADPHYRDRSVDEAMELLRDDMHVVTLGCGDACPFLADDKTCSIYPTRPNDCVAMEAGDEQCQQSRAREGHPPLQPTATEQLSANDEVLQAQYRTAYFEQLRRQQCPGCGEGGLF